MSKIEELGYLDKGTGKHQSNVVYSAGGVSPTLTAGIGVKYWILIVDTECAKTTLTASMQATGRERRLNSLSESIEGN